MERKIGEIFEYNGEWFQCCETNRAECCYDCFFSKGYGCKKDSKVFGVCGDRNFKKLEKVGEPKMIHGRFVLPVKMDAYKCMRCCFYSKGICELTMKETDLYSCGEETKFVAIKQSQEDMEEKRLNLKPFDLEAAKAGKPVCTRDGANARIICFDAKSETPIIALITTDDGTEITFDYLIDGTFANSENPDNDLMMLPEMKEGWAVIYKDDLLRTEKEAREQAEKSISEVIRIEKIEWEE